jgi:hypothetical protein
MHILQVTAVLPLLCIQPLYFEAVKKLECVKSTQNTTLNLVKFKKLIGKNNQGGEEFKGQQIMPCILIFCVDIFYEKFAKYNMIHLGCHPVAEVQYTFTHKQYIEQHKTNNT